MESMHTLLLVDDEPAVLNALRRVFHRAPYTILTAASGEDGMAMLAAHDVSLILSDQRMPGMIGAEFLRHAREQSPGTMRVILTGHADVDATVQAINEGGVHRYLLKPWDDDDLRRLVVELLELHDLRRDNDRLQAELRLRNRELEASNSSLEGQVAERTTELRLAHDELQLRVAELEGRDRIAQHLLQVHGLQDTLDLLVRVIVDILGLPVSVWMAAKGAPELAAGGTPTAAVADATFDRAYRAGGPAQDPGGMVVVPLVRGDEVLGFLGAEGQAGEPPSASHQRVLGAFAPQAAMAISDALLQADFGAWRRELDSVLRDVDTARLR